MKLKALIVDDEYPARQELRYALSSFDNIEIVGEATNAQEALALIRALDYQILFLDISMPGMTGLELGAAIQELPRQPHIIFITAFDEYAVQAFEVNAVDYVLKPVEPGRLKKAIDKVVRITQEVSLSEPAVASAEPQETELRPSPSQQSQIKIDRIPAEKQGKTVLVAESDVFYAFTEQDYIYIKTY
ncbi:MAG: LytR/AlgR family response regulator transcription factor, partial [Desulfocucumaceae bacterium]